MKCDLGVAFYVLTLTGTLWHHFGASWWLLGGYLLGAVVISIAQSTIQFPSKTKSMLLSDHRRTRNG